MLVRILTEPRNAYIPQYQALFQMDKVCESHCHWESKRTFVLLCDSRVNPVSLGSVGLHWRGTALYCQESRSPEDGSARIAVHSGSLWIDCSSALHLVVFSRNVFYSNQCSISLSPTLSVFASMKRRSKRIKVPNTSILGKCRRRTIMEKAQPKQANWKRPWTLIVKFPCPLVEKARKTWASGAVNICIHFFFLHSKFLSFLFIFKYCCLSFSSASPVCQWIPSVSFYARLLLFVFLRSWRVK